MLVLAAAQVCERSQCMQWPQANNFFGAFSIFESGGITKHLMTGPSGNSEFCFPETLNVPQGEVEGNIEVEGKQNSLFPERPVIKCFVIPPDSKREKAPKKLFA